MPGVISILYPNTPTVDLSYVVLDLIMLIYGDSAFVPNRHSNLRVYFWIRHLQASRKYRHPSLAYRNGPSEICICRLLIMISFDLKFQSTIVIHHWAAHAGNKPCMLTVVSNFFLRRACRVSGVRFETAARHRSFQYSASMQDFKWFIAVPE
jgi:hypothetical protein